MLWATSIPTLAFLVWPETVLWGAETSYNILCLLAPALNAYAAFLLVNYLTRNDRAALFCGFVFGFSPYVASHMLGHLNLVFVPLVPLMLLVCIRRARKQIGRPSFIAMLTVLVLLQFGISTEVLATSALLGTGAYFAFFCTHRRSIDVVGLAVDTGIAAIACSVLLIPAFYFLWLGAEQVPDLINSPIIFSNDLLDFIVPMQTTWIGGEALQFVTSGFTADASEQNAYLGLPLILLAITAYRSLRSQSWTKPLIATPIAAAIASLGPGLWINGHLLRIPMPWAIVSSIPLIQQALPGRLALYTSLGVTILIGMWLANLPSLLKYGLAAMSAVFILPNANAFSFGSYKTPAVFADPASAEEIGEGGAVVVLPYGITGNSILWQLRSDMRFKMAGGYIGFTPRYFSGFPALNYFSGGGEPASEVEFKHNVLAFSIASEVGSIVVTPGTPQRLVERLTTLNWPAHTVADSQVISVPQPVHDEPFQDIYGDHWASTEQGKIWLGKLVVVINNTPSPMHLLLTRNSTPNGVKPIVLSVLAGRRRDAYIVGTDGAAVTVSPWSHVQMIASSTWVPTQYFRNGDQRRLSVMAEIRE